MVAGSKHILVRRGIRQLVASDYLTAMLAWFLFWAYRNDLLNKASFFTPWLKMQWVDYLAVLVIIPCGWFFVYLLSGTYFDPYRKSRLNEINRTIVSCLIGSVIVALIVFANDSTDYSYFIGTTSRYLFIHTLCTLVGRLIILGRLKKRLIRREFGYNTLIIGGNQQAIQIYQQIVNNPKTLGNIFVGFIYSNRESSNGMSAYLPKLGDLSELEEIIRRYGIEEVLVAVDSSEHHLLENILTDLSYHPVLIKVLPDMYDIISGSVKTSNVFDAVLIQIYPQLMPDWQQVCKRTIDIGVALVSMLILSPLYLFAAIKVRMSSKGPIFYKQERIGLFGKPFRIYKFRSMYVDSEQAGPALSSKLDPRVTPWGRVMRKWRIDEVPQFFNILRGDMSLVGPRPERAHFIRLIAQSRPHYKYLHKVKPGLTSWGMVQYGYAENVDQMLERMRYDLLYIENCSLALDVKIMIYTLKVLFQGRGK